MEYVQKEQYYLSSYLYNLKFFRIMRVLDLEVTKNLRGGGVQTRPCKSNGLWCCVLLPTILILYSLMGNVSQLYSIIAYTSVALLFYCMLFLIFISVSSAVLEENDVGGCAAASLTGTLLLYGVFRQNLVYSAALTMGTVCTFSCLIRMTILNLPKTFTIGEVMIVLQAVVLYGVLMVNKIFLTFDGDVDKEMAFITQVNNTILSTVGLIVTALYLLEEPQQNMESLYYILMVALTYTLTVLHTAVGPDCLLRLSQYLIFNSTRVKLMLFWLLMVVLAVIVLLMRTKLAVKASTVTRKTFHILASAVFLSGILVDRYLMTLAAGIGLSVLIFVEALRKSKIDPISSVLQQAFDVYSDEKDVGVLAMTPLYLFTGLAAPLVLVPSDAPALDALSGVLAIGVGDTAASWYGSTYGVNRWPGSKKTLEGTAFNIMSQVAMIYALSLFGYLKSNFCFVRGIIAATISGYVEAKTDQIDNLVLPLVSLLAFQITYFIS